VHFLLTSCSPCFLLSPLSLSLSRTSSLSLLFCVFLFFSPRHWVLVFFPSFILPVAIGEQRSGLPFAWPPFFLALPSLSFFASVVQTQFVCVSVRSVPSVSNSTRLDLPLLQFSLVNASRADNSAKKANEGKKKKLRIFFARRNEISVFVPFRFERQLALRPRRGECFSLSLSSLSLSLPPCVVACVLCRCVLPAPCLVSPSVGCPLRRPCQGERTNKQDSWFGL
jgi:hypothetical protein